MLGVAFWTFEVEPNAVAGLVLLVVGYVAAVRGLGPRHAPDPRRPVSRRQVTSFALGVAALWLALGWPVHLLGERYLYMAHTLQHLILGLVAPPLLLMGTPGWILRLAVGSGARYRVTRLVTRPLPAFVIFNVVMVAMHWPPAVSLMVRSGPVHGASHLVMLVAGLVMWMPVVSPLPELPRLGAPANMLYLFLQSILPTVPASFLTFGETVLYHPYQHVPRLWGISPLTDQLVSGLLIKVGAGFLLWGLIAVLFFVWQAEEDHQSGRDRLDWDELELTEREWLPR